MVTKTEGKGTVVALAEQLIAGTSKHLANVTQVILAGGSFTPTEITARPQALVKLRGDVDAAGRRGPDKPNKMTPRAP